MKDEGVGVMLADKDDEVWVIGGGLYIAITYLLGRRRVIRAVDEVGLFKIEG